MNEWQELSLSEVAPYWTGKVEAQKLNEENFISADNMLSDRQGVINSVYTPTTGKLTSFKPKDILVSNIRPYFKKIWFANRTGGCSNDVIVFRPADFVNSRFIYYCLSNNDFFAYMMAGANGTKMPRGNKKSILKYKISLPPLPTQQKIAKILSNYDDLIENNLKCIRLLEESARLTYEEWFLRFRVDGNKLEINPDTNLPFGWELVKIGSLLQRIKTTVKIKSSEILESGNNPVIDQGADFIAGFTNETNINQYIDNAFIVFGDHSRILKFVNFSFARGADGTQILVSNNSRMPQTLFYHSLVSVDLSNYHYARHFKFLKDEKVILPTESTATKYNNKCVIIFNQIKNLRSQNQLLKEARDILLPRVMTGMIDTDKLKVAV
tara:strand:- start:445 stop:1590 length:1146 start_codon:yes stop_codon:yes gene_type:complete